MAEKPILFNGEMVRAILGGWKTQTRRPVRPQPPDSFWPHGVGKYHPLRVGTDGLEYPAPERFGVYDDQSDYPSPYAPGDLLYVRETWAQPENVIYYRADEEDLLPPGAKWSPPVRMPKWAARIWLRVTGVRVERVKDITADGVRAEGFPFDASLARPAYHFSGAWEAAYPGSWDRNDWVWVYEFERAEAPR